MNFQTISALIQTQKYRIEYINMTYSPTLNPVINVGIVKGKESISFNLICSCIEDFAKGIKELSSFVGWLAQNDEKEEG